MEKLKMKKISVFFICALVQMIAIGLFLRFVHAGDVVDSVVTAGSMFTPLVAVVFTQWLYKEPLFAGMGINLNFNRWWIIGWLLIPIMSLAILGMSLLMPGVNLSSDVLDEVTKDVPMQFSVWGFVGITLVSGLFGGATLNAMLAFGEEIAWRGFLVKELAGKKFIWAVLFIGVMWGAWHFPLILNGHNYPDHPVIGVFMMMVMCASLAPVMLYFRLKGGSIVVPVVMHGTFNAVVPMTNMLVHPANDLVVGCAGVAGIIVMLLFDAAIFLYDRYITKENLFTKPMEPQVRVPEVAPVNS